MQGNTCELSMARACAVGMLCIGSLTACLHAARSPAPAEPPPSAPVPPSGVQVHPPDVPVQPVAPPAQAPAEAPNEAPAKAPASGESTLEPAGASAAPADVPVPQAPKTPLAANSKQPRGGGSSRSMPTAPRGTPPPAPAGTGASGAQPPSPPAAKPQAAPTLDLAGLEQRLKETRAIGVFTKLSLKNSVDDLLDAFRAYHGGKPEPPLAELRQRYDLLLIKVLTLLQDGDPPLAAAIASSREAIWGLLADREKFQKILLG